MQAALVASDKCGARSRLGFPLNACQQARRKRSPQLQCSFRTCVIIQGTTHVGNGFAAQVCKCGCERRQHSGMGGVDAVPDGRQWLQVRQAEQLMVR